MSTATSVAKFGWLRSAPFDITLVFVNTAVALAAACAILYYPVLFPIILLIDLWVLGYHHVISTFTRISFDRESFRQHRFLITWLPVIIAVATIVLTLVFGKWALASVYLYWQWWHYTRQSYGIARIYHRKTEHGVNDNLMKLMIYAVPFWGILNRSAEAPERFLGIEIRYVPVSEQLVSWIGLAASCIFFYWLARELLALVQGKTKAGYVFFALSHNLIFFVGYICIANINLGWLVLNIWHNIQYILLVWMVNVNRFKDGIDPKHKFLSTISQRSKISIYFGACLLISTCFYLALGQIAGLISVSILPAALILHSIVNFHHYAVDAVIWKVRKKPLQKTLGLQN